MVLNEIVNKEFEDKWKAAEKAETKARAQRIYPVWQELQQTYTGLVDELLSYVKNHNFEVNITKQEDDKSKYRIEMSSPQLKTKNVLRIYSLAQKSKYMQIDSEKKMDELISNSSDEIAMSSGPNGPLLGKNKKQVFVKYKDNQDKFESKVADMIINSLKFSLGAFENIRLNYLG